MTKTLRYIVRLSLALLPFMFLPVIMDAYGFGRILIFMVLGIVGMLVWVGSMIIEKKETAKVNGFWMIMMLAVIWAAWLFYKEAAGVQARALTVGNGLVALTTLAMWGFLWLQITDKQEREKQMNWLTVSGLVAGVVSVVVFLIPAGKLPLIWPKDNPLVSISGSWSVTGSLISELVLTIFLASEWVRRLWKKLKSNETYIKEAVVVAVMLLVSGLGIVKIVKTGWVVLDGNTAWVVAVESFKRNTLTGVGVGNFIEAFNLYRPASYNNTNYWTNSFNVSANGWLHWWTETGLVGLGLLILVILMLWKEKKSFSWVQAWLLVLAVLFLPLNFMTLVLASWWLVVLTESERRWKLSLKVGENGLNVAPWVMLVVIIGLAAWGGFNIGKVAIADYYYRQALVAAAKNDGGTTYNLGIKAITFNPINSEYRRTYSQTNLALALSLLTNKDISDEDKQKVSVLIQQAVREAKAAASLEQQDAANWNNLAVIYKQIIGLVEGAPDWSYQAYQQAMMLDPTNPVLGMDLGGLLYAAGRYEEADRVFENVVTNKNDFANAWYNWAYSAKQLNRLGDAVSRLSQAVALVPATSGDYQKANDELATWRKEYDEAVKRLQEQQKQQVKQPETLKTPEPLPTVGKEEKVDIPAGELQPPTPMATPTTAEQSGGP